MGIRKKLILASLTIGFVPSHRAPSVHAASDEQVDVADLGDKETDLIGMIKEVLALGVGIGVLLIIAVAPFARAPGSPSAHQQSNPFLLDGIIDQVKKEFSEKGWRDAHPNAATLASFAMLRDLIVPITDMTNELYPVIQRIKWTAAIVAGGVVWHIARVVLGL